MSELKRKAIKGIKWNFLDKGGVQFVQFVFSILIARILVPEDYGLIGMISIFLVLSQLFINSGFSTALIQKGNDVTQRDYSTVFFFNLIIGMALYLLLFFGAPLIADFYGESRLVLLTRLIGLNLVIMSMALIQSTIFAKRINFKTTAKINVISAVSSSILGWLMALNGFGVMSLVAMILSESLIRTIFLWLYSSWRPSMHFSMKSFKSLFAVGSKLLIATLFNRIGNNIYSMVIGKFYTLQDVGYYDQAKKIQDRTGNLVTATIQGVLFSTQSLFKDELSRLRNSIRTNIKVTSLIVFPVAFGLIAVARPFVELFLTEKWLPSVIYIQLLAFGGLFFTLHRINYDVCIVIGRADFYMKYTIASNILLLGIIFFCLKFEVSLTYLITGKIVWQFLSFGFFYFLFIRKNLKYGTREYLMDFLPAILVSLIMAAFVYYLGYLFGISWLVFGLQILSGVFLFVLLNMLTNKKIFIEILKVLFSFKPKLQSKHK